MTIQEIRQRHSVRTFRTLPITDDLVARLKAEITLINSHEAGISFKLLLNNSEPLKAFNKSYGVFKNASNFIAAIVDYSFPDVVERAGYFAEEIVLKATAMGLGTCFVGGTYSKNAIPVPLRAGQEILFIILVGYEDNIERPRPLTRIFSKISHRKQRQAEDFYVERNGLTLAEAKKEFKYLTNGLEAVAAAPSSLNKQPVRIWVGHMNEQRVVRIGIPNITDKQLIDLGIAKCNFVEACGGYFDWGNGAAYYP